MGGRGLDWANQPGVFKIYPGLDTLPLPLMEEQPREGLYDVLCTRPAPDTTKEISFNAGSGP